MSNQRNHQLKRNVKLLRLIRAVMSFALIWPIIVVFFQDNGLSLTQIFLLQSIFAISIVSLEVPSSFLADVWGRRNTIILGIILYSLGYVVYSFAESWSFFVAAEIFLAVGYSSISGADSALLYDSLAELKQTESYKKAEGYIEAAKGFSEAIAIFIGGWLALVSLRLPFIVQASVGVVGIVAAWLLIEPKRTKLTVEKGVVSQIKQVFNFSLRGHPQVRWLIIFAAIVNLGTITLAWALQPILLEIGIDLAYFGPIIGVYTLFFAASALFADKLERKVGYIKAAMLVSLLVSATFIGLGSYLEWWFIPLIALVATSRGLINPIIKDSLNKLTDSSIRASVLSVQNFAFRLAFAIFGPIFGWMSDAWSLQTALLLTGLGLGASLPVIILRLKKA